MHPAAALLLATVMQSDTAYPSDAVRRIVELASIANRHAPAGLQSYAARVESEVAFVLYTPSDAEVTGQLEQFATEVAWERSGAFRQRVVGHRLQAAGPNVSAATYFPDGWTVPVLYGERLYFDRFDSTASGTRGRGGIAALHPFAEGREAVYRFDGGDTIATLQLAGGRVLRIVRIAVEPRTQPGRRATGFMGEIHLDADRHQIVRMRGRIVSLSPARGIGNRMIRAAMQSWAYIDFENAERDGQWWLPAQQRVELQVGSRASEGRAVIRIVSRFRDHRLNEPGLAGLPAAPRDSFALTYAPADTITTHSAWEYHLGGLTTGLAATDFEDVAPGAWRPGGVPPVRVGTERLADMVRYNRVEGLYTGMGVSMRPAGAQGPILYATGGRAWSEGAARGAVGLVFSRGSWQATLRAGRDLRHTNDFVAPFEYGLTESIMLLFGSDDFDYVDRSGATLAATRLLPKGARITLEAGALQDRPEVRRLSRGVFGGDALRANRPVTEGTYTLTRLTFERGRSTNATSLQPGIGTRLLVERAWGDLDWDRVEAGVQMRTWRGPFMVSARLNAGTLLGNDIPPQALYELGGTWSLPGYAYKEFAGSSAAQARFTTLLNLGVLKTPLRAGKLVLPAIAPGIVAQWHAGWTAADAAGAQAVAALGSSESHGVRSTVGLRLMLFGGTIGFGIDRALTEGRRWRFTTTIGGTL